MAYTGRSPVLPDDMCLRGNPFDIGHFLRLFDGRRRNKRTISAFKSLKSIQGTFVKKDSGTIAPARMLLYGGCYRYLRSLSEPKFTVNAAFLRQLDNHGVLRYNQDDILAKNAAILKLMCGIKRTPEQVAASLIWRRCISLPSLELRTMFFKFISRYIEAMDMDDIRQLGRMLKILVDSPNDDLLRCALAGVPSKSDILVSKRVLMKYWDFVWNCHPAMIAN
ncbi:hypothetical protein, conserved [Babesia bigemina]|uniref:Uncharacterized protein n=1 Tax=Babesia bigemina TaxID=5866 RepID=A0A061DEA4_BABBI|nr:hypothetical protein, conserved [Babesia bigemina]CDR98104.1 hypothetical protein, conserved [Babesia bigemina]|eukprot:XP_012770290.1 hypothetical protein, conserved [Babesia bigemina]